MEINMKKDLVSVILPVWKPNIKQLKQCINSVLKQTYTNIELIISYYKSPEFDDDFFHLMSENKDERIKVIECKNKGIGPSLNEGIEKSNGEFIARIDGDDYCEVNRIEKQLEYKKNNNCNPSLQITESGETPSAIWFLGETFSSIDEIMEFVSILFTSQ